MTYGFLPQCLYGTNTSPVGDIIYKSHMRTDVCKRKRIYTKKEVLLNDKNQAVIKVFVHDLESVISPFSLQDNIVINSEFANFLNQHILATHLIHDINIQIKSNNLEKQEDILLIKEAIKNYYYEEAIISYRKIKNTIIKSVIFTFLAVIIFSLVIFLNHLNLLSAVATEIIDIAGWVFMWEAVDLFFIERPLNKYELLKNHKLVEAVVNYCDSN